MKPSSIYENVASVSVHKRNLVEHAMMCFWQSSLKRISCGLQLLIGITLS